MVYCNRLDCANNVESSSDMRICIEADIDIDENGNCMSYTVED